MEFDLALKDGEIWLNEECRDQGVWANYCWARSGLQTALVHLQNREWAVHV